MKQGRSKRAKRRAQKHHKGSASQQRIGIDITAAVTQGGGIGRYTRELVQALVYSKRVDESFHFHLFSARKPIPPPTPVKIPAGSHIKYREARLSAAWLYRFWYRARFPLPVQYYTGEIDLFHSPDFVLPPVSGNIPTLLTVHDLSFIHYPETFTPALLRFLHSTVPNSVERATHILADSQATCDDLISLWHVPAEKISVLYGGVDPHFRPIADARRLAEVRAKYGLDDAPYLLSVGTIQPRKNYRMLMRALKPLTEQWPHVLAIAGGKGWLFDDDYAEVDRQQLEKHVRLLGFVDDEDLPALYSGATLFLFPSLYEGFGLPPLEAMACGVPVIVSDASCLPEVVGDAAIKLSPQDEGAWTRAMHRLLLSDQERSHMVAGGFLQARRFSWQRAARQLCAIYQQLLSDDQTG